MSKHVKFFIMSLKQHTAIRKKIEHNNALRKRNGDAELLSLK